MFGLGHGSPYGLWNPGKFPGAGLYIIDDSKKEDTIISSKF